MPFLWWETACKIERVPVEIVSGNADSNIDSLRKIITMYCKLFASLYQGTLRGRSNEILVFTNLLANCDREGYVDKHWRAIADEVGITVDEVKEAINHLESPDPESRSPEHDGSRLIKMDQHRAWGWRIVNYIKYRSIKDEDDRREQNRRAQANYRAKKSDETPESNSKQPSAIVSSRQQGKPESAHAEAEAEAEVEARHSRTAGAREIPDWKLVKAFADSIMLAEWKAEDEFQKLETNGWRDTKGQEIQKWQPYFLRVKKWWEADGRPKGPPSSNSSKNNGSNPKESKYSGAF